MRTNNKRLFSILLCLALLLGLMAVTASAEEPQPTELTKDTQQPLQSGTYVVKNHVEFEGDSTQPSGLRIDEGAEVTIWIEESVILTAKGADASGTTGAGAGIEVPESASLTLLGKGYLRATGGNAADGGAGADGLNGQAANIKRGGNGGDGGDGGGGGGAGIGSKGGNGGNGGGGGNGDYNPNAKPGKSGNTGGSSLPCGKITVAVAIMNNAQVKGGNGGSHGADGKQGIQSEKNNDNKTAWGGGGGGGGRGGAGADYGNGGDGGGGGNGGNGAGYSENLGNGANGAAGGDGLDGEAVVYYKALQPPVVTGVNGAALNFGYTEGSVSVTAEPEPDHEIVGYQWYINTTESNVGGTPIDTKEEPSAATAEYIIPTGKPAGTVEYYYCVVTAKLRDKNPPPANEIGTRDTVSDVATVTVGKADFAPSVATINHPYSGETQQLVKGGDVNGGTLLYALGKDSKNPPADGWSESVPTAVYPGTYYVWYRIVGDANHNDVAPACIEVTIGDNTACDFTLLASLKPTGKRGLMLRWTALPGAQGYDIFFGMCGNGGCDYVTSVDGLRYKFTKLKKGAAYKAVVRAWWNDGGKKVYIGEPSPDVHAIAGGKNNKYTDPKGISVKKKKITLAVGGTKKIKAKVTKKSNRREFTKHTATKRWFSSDRNVATVDDKGVVTGVGPGSCKIYVLAENGMRAAVKVTVK